MLYLICSLNDTEISVSCNKIPKCFYGNTCLTIELLKYNLRCFCFWDLLNNIIFWAYFVGLLLKLITEQKVQFFILDESLFTKWLVLPICIFNYQEKATYHPQITLSLTIDCQERRYINKNHDLSIGTCGAPALSSVHEVSWRSIRPFVSD